MPRLRPCIVPLACAGALLAVPAAAPAQPGTVTQKGVAGAKLGKTRAWYRSYFGTPHRVDRLEGGLERLVFTARDVEVYFKGPKGRGRAILTTSAGDMTARGVGPCSSVSALRSAYGTKLKAIRVAGRVGAYRWGRLTFAVEGGRVESVMLSRSVPAFVAMNSEGCRTAR